MRCLAQSPLIVANNNDGEQSSATLGKDTQAQRRSGPRRPYTSRGREVIIQAAATIITGYPFLRGATAQSRLSASFDGDSRFRWGLTQPIAIMVIVVKVPPPFGSRSSHPCPSFLPSRSVRRRAPRTPRRLPDGPGQRSGQRGPVGRQRLRAGGSCATVKMVLASSSVNPHDYEPSPADAVSFAGARHSTPRKRRRSADAATTFHGSNSSGCRQGPKPPAHSIRHRRDAAGTRPRLRGGTQRARRSDRVARQLPGPPSSAASPARSTDGAPRIRHPRGLSQNRPGAPRRQQAPGAPARQRQPARSAPRSLSVDCRPQTYSSSSPGVWDGTTLSFARSPCVPLRRPGPGLLMGADGGRLTFRSRGDVRSGAGQVGRRRREQDRAAAARIAPIGLMHRAPHDDWTLHKHTARSRSMRSSAALPI